MAVRPMRATAATATIFNSCRYCGGNTVVIPYGYSSGYARPIYTAPDYPEYGYQRDYYDDSYRDYDYGYDDELDVYNDNRTYNYYGDSGRDSDVVIEYDRKPSNSRPVQHEPSDGKKASTWSGGPVATRFTSQAEVAFDGTKYIFRVSDGLLSVSSGGRPRLHGGQGCRSVRRRVRARPAGNRPDRAVSARATS